MKGGLRRRVTGVNQKGRPDCVAVVGNQRKKQLHHLSYNNASRAVRVYVCLCDECVKRIYRTRGEKLPKVRQ